MASTNSEYPARSRAWWLTFPILAILFSHYIVDTYSALMPPLLGVVEKSFGMLPEYAALLLGLGSMCSGLAQPTFAWMSDRFNTRVFGALGVLLGAICITQIGYCPNQTILFVVYAIGMMGIGMFHPIAASTIGHLAGPRRSLAISLFFVFGMGGFFTGSLAGPEIATGTGGLRSLAWLIIPGLVLTVLLQIAISKVDHRKPSGRSGSHSMKDYDWWTITCLYFASVFRFIVNMALVYLLVRWMEHHVAIDNPGLNTTEIARLSAPFAGRANATMIVGQGVGGLLAGALIRLGAEKLPLVNVPLLFCPSIMLLAWLSPGWLGYAACFLAGMGFGSMTPVAISLGQRLMPYHTSLASAIMLGAAWAVASIGPWVAEQLIVNFSLSVSLIVTGVLFIQRR